MRMAWFDKGESTEASPNGRPLALTFGALALIFLAEFPAFASISVTGQVIADGQGVAEVSVQLLDYRTRFEQVWAELDTSKPLDPVAVTKTDAKGFFEFDVAEVGLWVVRVEAPGFVALENRLLPLLEPLDLPPADLTPAVERKLILQSADHQPVADARLAVFQVDAWTRSRGPRASTLSGGLWAPAPRFARSDAKGEVRVLAAVDETVAVEIVAAGHVPFLASSFRLYRPKTTIQLEVGSSRSVRVVDGQGRAVEDVLILPARDDQHLAVGKTDDRGAATLSVPSEGFDLVFLAANGQNARRVLRPSEAEGVAKPPGKAPKPLRIVLQSARQVVGRVIDRKTRAPLAGALVIARDRFGDFQRTETQGGYRLRLIDDEVDLTAGATGYLGLRDRWHSADGGAGPALALARAGSLSGQVVDRDGRAVAGVELTANQLRESRRVFAARMDRVHETLQVRTRPDGTFRFYRMAADGQYDIRWSHPGYAPGTERVESLVEADRKPLRIVLETGLRAEGLVLDDDDQPIRGVGVQLIPSRTGDGLRMARRFLGSLVEDKAAPDHVTDREGRFVIRDIAPGRYDLVVGGSGYAKTTVRGLEILEGEHVVDLGVIILLAAVELGGQVVDTTGRAIADAEVHWILAKDSRFAALHLVRGISKPPAARTDHGGYFVVGDLAPGERITILVAKPGYVGESATGVEAPESAGEGVLPIRIVLRPASRVLGQVVDEEDQPLPGARVSLRAEGRGGSGGRGAMTAGSRGRAEADAEGFFVIDSMAPGVVTLTAEADGYQPTRLSGLTVPEAGDLVDVRLELKPGATVQGLVRDGDGAPITGARVQVTNSSGGRRGRFSFGDSVLTDGDGRYRILGVSPGLRVVKATYEDLQEVAIEAEVELGTNTVDLTLEQGVEVSGWVFDEARNPVAGATVYVSSSSSVRQRRDEKTGPDGSFLMTGVGPGSYEVGVTKDGYADATLPAPLEIAGTAVQGLELTLTQGATVRGRILGLDFDELAEVELMASGPSYQSGEVDFEGAFTIGNLAPGAWTLMGRVRSSGRQAQESFQVEAGVSEIQQDLRFGSGYTLSGSFHVDDQPVQGATVIARHSEQAATGQGYTDHNGLFRLEGLEEGRYAVMIFDLGSDIQHHEEVDLNGDQALEVTLWTGSIAGFLKDQLDQSPIGGGRIEVERMGQENVAPDQRWRGRGAESDSRGYFNVGRVPEGHYKFTARREGYAPAEQSVEVLAGQDVDDVEIRLRPTEGLVFEVLLPSGYAPSRVEAVVVDAAGHRVTGGSYTTTDRGRVRISDVPPGTYELLLAASGTALARHPVLSPGDGGRLQLAAGGQLEVLVPELVEEPQSAQVFLLGPDSQPHQQILYGRLMNSFQLRRGRAEFTQLDAGRYTVRVEVSGGQWSSTVQIVPGVPAQVSLQ